MAEPVVPSNNSQTGVNGSISYEQVGQILATYGPQVASSSAGGPYSSKSTSIDLSSPTEAATIIDQAFLSELGRTASDKEVAAFQKALNLAQKGSPTITTESGNRAAGGTTSTSTSTGKFDPTRFAMRYAQSQEGASEYYAGTTFMNVINKLISQPDLYDKSAGEVSL